MDFIFGKDTINIELYMRNDMKMPVHIFREINRNGKLKTEYYTLHDNYNNYLAYITDDSILTEAKNDKNQVTDENNEDEDYTEGIDEEKSDETSDNSEGTNDVDDEVIDAQNSNDQASINDTDAEDEDYTEGIDENTGDDTNTEENNDDTGDNTTDEEITDDSDVNDTGEDGDEDYTDGVEDDDNTDGETNIDETTDDTSTDEGEQEETPEDIIKSKALLNDSIDLHDAVKNTIDQLNKVNHTNFLINKIIAQVNHNLSDLKNVLYHFITYTYKKNTYLQNLYIYNYCIEAYKINAEMLKKISIFSANK